MNNIDKQYTDLLQDILDNGTKKETRNGGTTSVFGRQIRHDMKTGFPLLTTKKMPFKTMVTELLWFLRGENNIKLEYDEIDQIQNLINDLKTNPDSRRLMVNSWNVGELSEMVLPPCHYGFQVYTRELSLLERREIAKDKLGQMEWADVIKLAHYKETYDKYNIPTRAISLMWNQRSVDTFLGLPFNIASYGLLLEIIAKTVNMVPDELIGNLGDVHLYSNHIEQAKEQIGRKRTHEEMVEIYNKLENKKDIDGLWTWETRFEDNNITTRTREPYPLPKLNINTEFWPYEGGSCGEGPLDAVKVFEAFKDDNFCKCLLEEDIQLSNYQSHPTIKAPLSN